MKDAFKVHGHLIRLMLLLFDTRTKFRISNKLLSNDKLRINEINSFRKQEIVNRLLFKGQEN